MDHSTSPTKRFHAKISKLTRRISAENCIPAIKKDIKTFSSSTWNIGSLDHRKESNIPPNIAPQSSEQDTYLPVKLNGEIPDILKRRAREHLGETPEVKELALRHLKELILRKDYRFDFDDNFLLTFLRGKKFNIERAFEAVDNFGKQKKLLRDIYQKDPSKCLLFRRLTSTHVSNYRDQEGRMLFFTKLRVYEPDKVEFKSAVVSTMVTVLKFLEEPANQIAGVVWVIDCHGLNLKYLKIFKYSDIFTIRMLFLKCVSISFQQIHILNENAVVNVVMKFIDRILPLKIKNRLYCHGHDMKSLQKAIPVALLPQEYGGKGTDFHIIDLPEDLAKCKFIN